MEEVYFLTLRQKMVRMWSSPEPKGTFSSFSQLSPLSPNRAAAGNALRTTLASILRAKADSLPVLTAVITSHVVLVAVFILPGPWEVRR